MCTDEYVESEDLPDEIALDIAARIRKANSGNKSFPFVSLSQKRRIDRWMDSTCVKNLADPPVCAVVAPEAASGGEARPEEQPSDEQVKQPNL